MPHVGKVYPVLFERDFSLWQDHGDYRMPRQIEFDIFGGGIPYLPGWGPGTYVSRVGVADYTIGFVSFVTDAPPTCPPNSMLQFNYYLAFDETWGKYENVVINNTVVVARSDHFYQWQYFGPGIIPCNTPMVSVPGGSPFGYLTANPRCKRW